MTVDANQPYTDYPVDALPSVIGKAVLEYQRYGQQPQPLVAASALSAVSLCCQTLANVARDSLLISPVSMYFITVASSGERKTASDAVFNKAIRQWQQNIINRHAPLVERAHNMHKAWRAEQEGLLSQIRRSALEGIDTTWLKEQFADLMEQEPAIPVTPRLFFEDVTSEALAYHLAQGWPSASLSSDEGAIVLNGHGMQSSNSKFVAMLNRLWDGKDFIAHRKTSESFTVRNRRLTLSLMMQPLILQQLLSKDNGINRQSGFLARCLISFPQSEMGKRFYQAPPEDQQAMQAFDARIKSCLDTSLSLDRKGCHTLPSVTFTQAAKKIWINFFDKVEYGLSSEDEWRSIPDFASKAGENAARLAALFHLFDGAEGDISSESTEKAINLIEWHLLEIRRIFRIRNTTVANNDATKLQRYIKNKGLQSTSYRNLRQSGPIRDATRLTRAINELLSDCYLKEIDDNGKTAFLVTDDVANVT